MFDSLKEKLGRFQEDVEEAAEEKAVEAEADAESPEEADAEAGADAAGEGTAGRAAAETEADFEADSRGEEEADSRGEEEADPGAVEDGSEGGAVPGGTDVSDGPGSAAGGGGDASSGADGEAGGATVETEAADAEPADVEPADSGAADAGSAGNKGTGLGRKLKSAARGRFVIEADDLEDPLWNLKMALLDSNVELSVAEEILDGIEEELVGETRGFTESTGSIVTDALRSALLDVIGVGQFDFDERVAAADTPVVIVFTGVNGVGKTTTIAKMARYFEEHGLSTVLANGDTYRAGANEQIEEHAERLDKRVISHQQGGDPTAVIYDAVEYAEANDVDVVLGDTAGRLHTDQDLMAQLEKIHRVVDPDMTLFVDEAVAGQDAVRRAEEFDEAAEIDGAILTKADADAQGGAAISIAHVTGKPILFLGTGQEYDDLERFDPEWLVDQLLGED